MDDKIDIQEQLDDLLETKLNIKTAINSNGGEVTDETTFREYPEQIQKVIDESIVPYSDLEDTIELAMDINGFNPIEVEIVSDIGIRSTPNSLCIEFTNYTKTIVDSGITCNFKGFQPWYRSPRGVAYGIDYLTYSSQTAISSSDGACILNPIFEITNTNTDSKKIKVEVYFSTLTSTLKIINDTITVKGNTIKEVPWAGYVSILSSDLKLTKINNSYYFDSILENEIKERCNKYLNMEFIMTIL